MLTTVEQEIFAALFAKYGLVGRIRIGKSQIMLSTSIELDVNHVEFVSGSGLAGRRLRATFDVTNSKCNFERNETRSIENEGVHESGIDSDK